MDESIVVSMLLIVTVQLLHSGAVEGGRYYKLFLLILILTIACYALNFPISRILIIYIIAIVYYFSNLFPKR